MFFGKKKKDQEESDKRTFPRIDLFQSTYYLPGTNPEESEGRECWINNISLGGLSLDVDQNTRYRSGDTLIVLYRIGRHVRKDLVRIVHSHQAIKNWRCGCVFEDDSPERDRIIRDCVEKQMM